eukprot:5907008-Pleurochrysis_carterae.AAC.2
MADWQGFMEIRPGACETVCTDVLQYAGMHGRDRYAQQQKQLNVPERLALEQASDPLLNNAHSSGKSEWLTYISFKYDTLGPSV